MASATAGAFLWQYDFMSNVARLHHVLLISQDINKALTGLDSAIAKAIDAAKAAGLPQGFVVSLLHGCAQQQTSIMVGR